MDVEDGVRVGVVVGDLAVGVFHGARVVAPLGFLVAAGDEERKGQQAQGEAERALGGEGQGHGGPRSTFVSPG
ncbi:MAG: hypothetical protein ACK559_33505, partial [bacterium]